MSSRLFSIATAGILMVATLAGCSAISAHHRALFGGHGSQAADPITGEWSVTFYVHETKTPATFTFKVDGRKSLALLIQITLDRGQFAMASDRAAN